MGFAKSLAGACLLWAALTAGAQAQPAWDVARLMRSLAQVHAATASFTETKTMAVLSTKLQTTGTLRYIAPDYLRKTILTPAPEDFVLQNGAVTLTGAGQTRHFTLSQAPQLAGLVEGVRATLAGDLPALQRYYSISLSGGARNWQLLLRPRDAGLQQFLSWLCIRGHDDVITGIDTAGAHGDQTSMQVRETLDHAL
jgi:hypothetical protein